MKTDLYRLYIPSSKKTKYTIEETLNEEEDENFEGEFFGNFQIKANYSKWDFVGNLYQSEISFEVFIYLFFKK